MFHSRPKSESRNFEIQSYRLRGHLQTANQSTINKQPTQLSHVATVTKVIHIHYLYRNCQKGESREQGDETAAGTDPGPLAGVSWANIVTRSSGTAFRTYWKFTHLLSSCSFLLTGPDDSRVRPQPKRLHHNYQKATLAFLL